MAETSAALRFSGARLILSLLSTLLALAVGWSLIAQHERAVFLVFIVAVITSTWLGGKTAGFVSMVMSLAVLKYFFLAHQYSFLIHNGLDFIGLALFAVCSVVLIELMSRYLPTVFPYRSQSDIATR